jgi:hypothetical protein
LFPPFLQKTNKSSIRQNTVVPEKKISDIERFIEK